MYKRFLVCFAFFAGFTTSAMVPNRIISRSKPVYSSGGAAAYLVDNKFGGISFTVSNGSWIAVNVGPTNHSNVFVNWNSPDYSWSDVIASAHSCKNSIVCPVNYTIQKSSNSTNGINGTWVTVASVSGNNVTARGHLVDFTGASWIKMNISTGGGTIDELEVFDVSADSDDIWFFPGTSISANTYKGSVPAKDFADLIAEAHPGFNPVMVRAGIPCINSGDLATDISKYMKMARNTKYWAIEMGTNDAWGGSNYNVTTYKHNMQLVIDSCKAAGIQPMIARMIGTNATAATWQVHPDFLKAIDSLTIKNNLVAGPDLYTWFTTHTSELNSDGVHPNATGAASIQRLWAQKIDSLYPATVTGIGVSKIAIDNIRIFPNPATDGEFKILLSDVPLGSLIQIYDVNGKQVFNKTVYETEIKINAGLIPGIYIVKIIGENDQVLLSRRLVSQ